MGTLTFAQGRRQSISSVRGPKARKPRRWQLGAWRGALVCVAIFSSPAAADRLRDGRCCGVVVRGGAAVWGRVVLAVIKRIPFGGVPANGYAKISAGRRRGNAHVHDTGLSGNWRSLRWHRSRSTPGPGLSPGKTEPEKTLSRVVESAGTASRVI